MAKMLKDRNLPSLQDRRREKRLVFLYKIAAGLIPAIPAEPFLTPVRNKRQTKTTSRSDFTSSNIIRRFARNNNCCFSLGSAKTDTYRFARNNNRCFSLGSAKTDTYRFARNNNRCFSLGSAKTDTYSNKLLHQNGLWLEQPHRGGGVCKVGGGISIPPLDSALSALPIFPVDIHARTWPKLM